MTREVGITPTADSSVTGGVPPGDPPSSPPAGPERGDGGGPDGSAGPDDSAGRGGSVGPDGTAGPDDAAGPTGQTDAVPWSPLRHRTALALLLASVLLVFVAALQGESAVEPRLPGAGALPPYSLTGAPAGAALVVGLLVAALVSGAVGLWLALGSLRAGWRPAPRRLLALGLLAVGLLAIVPPTGSADPESYAAYGRAAATGHNPYLTTPRELAKVGDPVAAAVEAPWKDTPSVYGPVATGEQLLASWVGGRSVRTTVVILAMINSAAFALTGLLLYALSSGEAARRRAVLLWLLNPLLLFELVSGAHIDTLVALGCVAGIGLARRAPPVAGVLLGLAAAVKLPALFVLAGAAWAARRSPRALTALVAGALAVLVPAYVLAGTAAFGSTRRASRLASWATPWRPLVTLLDHTVHQPASRTAMSGIAVAVTLALAWLLLRRLGRESTPAAAGFAVFFAYLLAAPYALPWYDATAWALLALLATSPYDALLLARTTALSLAYLTRAAVELPTGVHATVTVLRNGVSPVALAVVLVAVVLYGRRRPRGTA